MKKYVRLMSRLFLINIEKNNKKKSKYWGTVSNCAVILLVISSLIIQKASKYSRGGEKIEIENAIYITLNSNTIINIKIKI